VAGSYTNKTKRVLSLTLAGVAGVFFLMIWYSAELRSQTIESQLVDSQEVDIIEEQVTVELPTPEDFLEKVNEERAKVGVAPLTIDERINKSAQRKADDMANNDYFDHVSPVDGRHGYEYIFEGTGHDCVYAGENAYYIGYGPNYSLAPVLESAINGWINSPPHYEGMVDAKYSLTGFGVVRSTEKEDGTYNVYAVQHFCELR
jgi:uncharacterized protein YkwD